MKFSFRSLEFQLLIFSDTNFEKIGLVEIFGIIKVYLLSLIRIQPDSQFIFGCFIDFIIQFYLQSLIYDPQIRFDFEFYISGHLLIVESSLLTFGQKLE